MTRIRDLAGECLIVACLGLLLWLVTFAAAAGASGSRELHTRRGGFP